MICHEFTKINTKIDLLSNEIGGLHQVHKAHKRYNFDVTLLILKF